MLKGIDVWAGNGNIEWTKVKQDGNAFAYVRAAYGNVADTRAKRNLNGARQAGLACGTYHFIRATRSYDEQIELMLRQLDELEVGPGDLPPAVDVEDNPHWDGPWDPARNGSYLDGIERWIAAVRERIGAEPVLYTRAGFWSELGSPSRFSNCRLWVASYRSDKPQQVIGWNTWTFWQYSESGRVPGVASDVDLDSFVGSQAQLSTLLLQ